MQSHQHSTQCILETDFTIESYTFLKKILRSLQGDLHLRKLKNKLKKARFAHTH